MFPFLIFSHTMNIFRHAYLTVSSIALAMLVSCSPRPTEDVHDGFILVHQAGPTLGYSPTSGVNILHEGKYAFKDLNRNGQLDAYEDWRLDIEERVKDLADQLTLEEIAGLMLYSSHQSIPANGSWGGSTYNGKPYAESGAAPWELSNNQKKFLRDDHLRHVLITTVESPEVSAKWNNVSQAFVEGIGHGIPNNNSSDPRHSAGGGDSEFNAGAGGDISLWPCELGMGATFDANLMREYGRIASAEYRALGFATCLSPQVDIATDPRWMRFNGTYGEDPQLVKDLAEAYCDGFQTSTGKSALYGAWGMQSVNAMAKHWPGGGPCESGRDAHYGRGKFAVYPNNNLALQKVPFLEGAFKLKNGTGSASAVMPYYTISLGQSNETVANNFNYDIITRQLRDETGYDGVVCTDWAVTADEVHPGLHAGKPFGVEKLTVAERHLKALRAGVDQFGGNNDKEPVLWAFSKMIEEDGEQVAMQRIRMSARRLLRNIFRTGLFENPYLIPEESSKIVGNSEFLAKGYEAQLKSIVMLKNHNHTLPFKNSKQLTVYIPQRIYPAHNNFWGFITPEDTIIPVKEALVEKYFNISQTAEDADVAIVFIDSPNSGWGHNLKEALGAEKSQNFVNNYFIPDSSKVSVPGNGYYPISLQYEDYVAEFARKESIGQGDPYETIANRSYKGKGVKTFNASDLTLVRDVRKKMGNKPVVVIIETANPPVLSELEPLSDAIFLTFQVQKQAVFDLLTGKSEPSALLPFQMPADMQTVEMQAEDTPHDMRCYRDSDNNTYDFAFGLNWSGVIHDWRVKKYSVRQ